MKQPCTHASAESLYFWSLSRPLVFSYLADHDILHGVAQFPVAQFMPQDSQDLWVVAALLLIL